MSSLSFGCNSCSTVESFNGSLQGVQGVFGSPNNNAINQMIAEQQNNNNMGGQNNYNGDTRPIPEIPQSNNIPGNNSGTNNYNTPVVNKPQMNQNNSYGNGMNNTNHPMNGNYNDIKVPQVIGASAKPVQKVRAKPVNVVPVNNNIVSNDIDTKKDGLNKSLKCLIVILTALSLHETIKYYINHAIKFEEGSPKYYIYYAVACLVIAYGAHQYLPSSL